MGGIITFAAQLVLAGKRAYERKWIFLGLFAFIFLGSVVVLSWLDLLPHLSAASIATAATVAKNPTVGVSARESKTVVTVALPTKIEIPKINLSATIANPTTTIVESLDKELLTGAVRYPTSAKLGETGNMVLFGHSSYLPVVYNQAYKTFNGIQKLSEGDVVIVYSADRAYTYRVKSVAKESANDAGIPLSVAGSVLTLATCDSFGAKTDRFIVVADLVESHSIST